MSAQGGQGGKRQSGPKSRTSDFWGVTQYRRTGRWEAHIWDAAEGGARKGRQLHLGSFPEAVPAAVAYDRAAVKLRGPQAALNFPGVDYLVDPFLREHGHLGKEDFVFQLRVWAQSAQLAQEYGLPEPTAGVAHPLRTRKRAPSPASGMEPAARRQRTLAPKKAKTGASNQDADVVYVGTSSREDRQQGRRSLRVRRARPAYAECSDLDEPEETGGRRHEHPTAAPAPVAAAEPQSRSNVQLQPPVQARQGYMPSAAQPAPTPGAWAFLDVTPEEATRKPTPFSPGVVTVRNDKLEWEAGGTPSVGLLNFVTGASLLNYRLPAAESPAAASGQSSPSDSWSDLPALQDVTPRKTALGQLPIAGHPTLIEEPLGVACTAAAPPSSPGSQLDNLDWSFLSPLQSCKSPGLSHLIHLGKSPRFSPAQSLSPARGIQSLAYAFEQGYQIPLSPVDMAPKRRRF